MRQSRNGLRLAIESLRAICIAGKSGWEHFDRDIAIEARVARTVDLTHSACANGADDFIGSETRAWRNRHQGWRSLPARGQMGGVSVSDLVIQVSGRQAG